jgi:uncharacterized protein YkwD
MRSNISFMVILFIWALASASFAQTSRPLPVFPQSRQSARPEETERAKKLYQFLRKENQALIWNNCLAAKASLRARQLVTERYFEHEDPKTGKNPVWKTVFQCFSSNRLHSAGENLARGIDPSATPADIHQALMDSPTHRKNILDRRFNRVGVGCYERVCVELFAGI